MIIYNTTWLNNLELQNQFEDDHNAGLITTDELKALKQTYPVGFYRPGIIWTIGLFIFTFIIASFSSGLISLVLADTHIIETFIWPLILGAFSYFILERFVKHNHYYRSGVDNALIIITAGLLIGGFVWMMFTINPNLEHFGLISLFICLLNIYFTLRFADVVTSIVACMAVLAFIFFGWQDMKLPSAILPFVMMLASAGIYWFCVKLYSDERAKYYQTCLDVAQIVALVALYLSGNYFVVQQLGGELMGAKPGAPVPFGFIFWIWTLLLPIAYIARGVQKKDVILLRTGLLLIVASVFTFRNYYHVLPAETAFTIGGIILLAISIVVIRYLKTPKHGITYADLNRRNLMANLNIESLIVGETFAKTPGAQVAHTRFGGGSAGGGGSSGEF
ncbi:hypothetical protein [Mucilaginibacter terrae]|uniref:Membrane protein n=1 Tax=Mucilaginibacter terrae TaxID=1955052 RepID=A0ABU3GRY8_9SPHI|nr:hypothetical protein [Mucilaginibacter terrae]MDT3402526.1 putative membrane protein [Mucilaginibacter terrae]